MVTLTSDGIVGLARMAGTGVRIGDTPAYEMSTFCKIDDDSLMAIMSSTAMVMLEL
jgi:hypothetical protein